MKKSFFFILISCVLIAVCLVLAVPYVLRLDRQITDRFEGRRWELPARIYARPLELYADKLLSPDNLDVELYQLRYRRVDAPDKPGEYSVQGGMFTIYSRKFSFPDALQPAALIELEIENKAVTHLTDHGSGEPLTLFRLEPLQYASIVPAKVDVPFGPPPEEFNYRCSQCRHEMQVNEAIIDVEVAMAKYDGSYCVGFMPILGCPNCNQETMEYAEA